MQITAEDRNALITLGIGSVVIFGVAALAPFTGIHWRDAGIAFAVVAPICMLIAGTFWV